MPEDALAEYDAKVDLLVKKWKIPRDEAQRLLEAERGAFDAG